MSSWDLHATATPGDATEVSTMAEALSPGVLATARKRSGLEPVPTDFIAFVRCAPAATRRDTAGGEETSR